MNTTPLWVAGADAPYRLVYLMPPWGEALANGIEFLGGARHWMLLVRTERRQDGSDAIDDRGLLAIDAGTGMVYTMLDQRKDKQCLYRL
jgi:hypothetical protein